MKSTLFILLMSFSVAFCDDDFVGTRGNRFKDYSYDFDLTKSALAKAPHWQKDEEFPPLSPKKAQEIALALAKVLRPEVTKWNLDRISLEPIRDVDWIYLVIFQDFSGPIAGVPWSLQIPVYLDGSTIVPKIKPLK